MHISLFIIRGVLIISNAIIVKKALEQFLRFKHGIFTKIFLLFSCSLLTSMIIFIGDLANLPPTAIIFLLSICICCEGTTLQKITIGIMFISTAFSFNALTDNYFNYFPVTHSGTILLTFTLRFIFWFLMYLLIRRFAPNKDYQLSSSLWRLLLLLTMPPIGIVCSIVLLTSPYNKSISGSMFTYFFLLVLALFSMIALFWTILVLSRQQELEEQNVLMEINQLYYENLEQQQFQVKRLKHDMANHLQLLTSLPHEEKDAYVNALIQKPVFTQTVHYCADSTVNAVLSAKSSQMNDNNITFQIKADIAQTLPFEKPDVCAIFANALDNAMEACMKLDAEKRKIILETRMEKGLFVLKLKNPVPFIDKTMKSGSFPKTSKKDTSSHGFGLRSIKEAILRYDGNMEVSIENNEFCLFIYIPL